METKTVLQRLLAVQQDLKAPKNQYNSFGDYKYRSCEDILQAARPLCNANGLVLLLRDDVEAIGSRTYIKATVAVVNVDSGENYSAYAYAREEESRPKMSPSQLTGAASSYARKYALCGLFALDDTKDADSDQYIKQNNNQRQNKPQGNQDGEKHAAMVKVKEAAQKFKITNEDVKKVIQWKYKKDNSQFLSAKELNELAANIANFYDDMVLDGSFTNE